MTDKSLKTGVFLLFIGFSILVSFSFFCMSITHSQNFYKQLETTVSSFETKVDSLEHVINTSFKEKQDTIIIKVVPQQVKVYYNKEN